MNNISDKLRSMLGNNAEISCMLYNDWKYTKKNTK